MLPEYKAARRTEPAPAAPTPVRRAASADPRASAVSCRLQKHPRAMVLWTIVATFGTYACMYGLRKPFTAAAFAGATQKSWFITAQVLGYTLSKMLGIRLIAEASQPRRTRALLATLVLAEAMLLLFAVAPKFLKAGCLFFNGLFLGMVFGLVLGFVEGRRLTEMFVAALCASFILADGFSKLVGANLLQRGVPETWMPAAAGALFLLPLLGFLKMLAFIPPPTVADTAQRAERGPVNAAERKALLKRIGLTLWGVILAYTFITILRSLRADFTPEILRSLGAQTNAADLAQSELLVALAVCICNGALVFVRDNRRALLAGLLLSLLGLFAAALLFLTMPNGLLSPFTLLVLSGVGLYIPYVAVHTTILERLLALTRSRGNLGFLMYVADTSGYLGYAVLMLAADAFPVGPGFLKQYQMASFCLALLALLALAVALQKILKYNSLHYTSAGAWKTPP